MISRIGRISSNLGFKRYLFNTGWMLAEKVLRLIAAVFVGAYVARYLGPSRYGTLNYVISLTALLSAISTLGLDQIVIRELIKDESKTDSILGTSFILKLIGCLCSFIILASFALFIEEDDTTVLLIFFVSAGTLLNSFGVIDFFFQAKVLSKFVAWSQVFTLIIVSILRIWLVSIKAPLEYFGLVAAFDFVFFAVGLIFFYSHVTKGILNWRFNKSQARFLLISSWPLIFAELATSIYMRFDQILIKWLINDEANGYYGVAVRLSEMWNFIPLAICGSLFPAILSSKLVNEKIYNARLQWLYSLMILISVSIAIPMTFLSEPIVVLLFGNEYSQAGSILAIYIWSSVFIFIGVANGKWIVIENLQNFRMVTLCASGVLNILLTYFFVQWIGLLGAAISSLITYSFAGYFCFLLTAKTRRMFVQITESFNLLRILKKEVQ